MSTGDIIKAWENSFQDHNLTHLKLDEPLWDSKMSTAVDQLSRRAFQPDPFEDVKNAKTVEDVISALTPKFNEISERLICLQKAVEEDEENESIEFQSLRNFGMFMLRRRLPTPQIGITLNGLVQAVWRLPNFGALAMDFQKSGDITFSVLYNQRTQEGRRRKISGELPPTPRHAVHK